MKVLKVLVVEDDVPVQTAFARILRGKTDVLLADDVEEARSLYRDHPDIFAVLMDGTLVSGSTVELVRELRRTFSGTIVAVSGSEHTNLALVAAGADSYWTKPGSPADLLRLLGV